jgi:hypothetical protein
MKLAIMQPYFFPYIGYFQLINATDKWIIFDIVQYMRHHWVNRNRVLHPNSGWQYIIVPLKKHSRDTLIKDIIMADGIDWKNKIIGKLRHYKKKAPFYEETITFLNECLFAGSHNNGELIKLNTFILKTICEKMNIRFDYDICSEIDLPLEEIRHPDEWALTISKQLGAEEYINPYGGENIFDSAKFTEKNIKLKFLKPTSIEYEQKGYEFEPYLSIIDVMMWNSEYEIRSMLNHYELIT